MCSPYGNTQMHLTTELLSQLQQWILKKTKYENLYAPYLLLGVLRADNLKGQKNQYEIKRRNMNDIPREKATV